MRVLLDECLPRKLKFAFPEHEVRSAQQEGWGGLRNGALLQVASAGFDVFLTVDRNIEFQQNLQGLPIAIVAMVVPSNRLGDLLPMVGQVRAALIRAKPGAVTRVGDIAVREHVPGYRFSRSAA